MKKITVFLCGLFLLMTMGSANAAILTFEDLPGGSTKVPSGYGGFNWTSGSYPGSVLGHNYPGSGYDIGTIGNVSIVNLGAQPIVNIDLVGSGTFTFNGAQFTGGWENLTLQFFGYNDGLLVNTSNVFNINKTSPTWIELDWSGIDSMQIRNPSKFFAMDNFTFNEPSSVPIPGAFWLLGSGLIGLVGFSRKRLKAKPVVRQGLKTKGLMRI